MTAIKEDNSLQANGAKTSDWIGQIKGGVLYAYDLGMLTSENKGTVDFTKSDFERDLKKVSRKIKK